MNREFLKVTLERGALLHWLLILRRLQINVVIRLGLYITPKGWQCRYNCLSAWFKQWVGSYVLVGSAFHHIIAVNDCTSVRQNPALNDHRRISWKVNLTMHNRCTKGDSVNKFWRWIVVTSWSILFRNLWKKRDPLIDWIKLCLVGIFTNFYIWHIWTVSQNGALIIVVV